MVRLYGVIASVSFGKCRNLARYFLHGDQRDLRANSANSCGGCRTVRDHTLVGVWSCGASAHVDWVMVLLAPMFLRHLVGDDVARGNLQVCRLPGADSTPTMQS